MNLPDACGLASKANAKLPALFHTGPIGFAHDVGDHLIELDVGIFERLLQPLDMAYLLADPTACRAD